MQSFLFTLFSGYSLSYSLWFLLVRLAMEDETEDIPPPFIVTVIGDSNIQRNLVDYNCGAREELRSAQVIPCTSLSTFGGCLPKVRLESTVLILSCLSNFLRDSESSSDPSVRITATLETFRSILFPYVDGHPNVFVLIAPPQFSRVPIWYSESLGLAIQLLRSLVIDTSGFNNLQLLPAFSNQVLFVVSFCPVLSSASTLLVI